MIETEQIYQIAKKEVSKINDRDRFVAGIAFYAAEGSKTSNNAGFTNSDPKTIKFMTNWFLDFVKVPKDKLRCSIWLHEGLSDDKARLF